MVALLLDTGLLRLPQNKKKRKKLLEFFMIKTIAYLDVQYVFISKIAGDKNSIIRARKKPFVLIKLGIHRCK